METKLLTIEEVARIFGVSTSTVRRWISSGKLVGQKAGAQWRFDAKAVQESFEQGVLSGSSRRSPIPSKIRYNGLREDEISLIMHWMYIILEYLKRTRPSHVVVVDRRGAKLWTIMGIEGFRWGENLWHSTAIEQMVAHELRRLFSQKTVLLFDDLMERGKTIHGFRQRLETAGARVVSLVCVRNMQNVKVGQVVEREAFACEDVDEGLFSERVTFISRLVSFFEPPLDVDHLIVKARITPSLRVEDFLNRLAKWGRPLVIWYPKNKNEYLAITLDRPQFFDVGHIDFAQGFSLDWCAPCKVRFYILLEEGICYCSFIAYPGIQASTAEWTREAIGMYANTQLTLKDSSIDLRSEDGKTLIRAVYWHICMNLASKLFNDFVVFGAAEDIGIRFDNSPDAIDIWQLKAAFGSYFGGKIAEDARKTLARAKFSQSLSPGLPKVRVPMGSGRKPQGGGCRYDALSCRKDLLKAVPQRESGINSSTLELRPVSYCELFCQLSEYSESTIGTILDNELDKATVKPDVEIDYAGANESPSISAWRGFKRGEFDTAFEFKKNRQTYDEKAMQRTMALGAIVVEDYLRRTGKSRMTMTEFNKIFANIRTDWNVTWDKVFFDTKPWYYGPVPIIPAGVSPSGQEMPFHSFLVSVGALSEIKEQHGSQKWSRFMPNSESSINWQELYEQKTSGMTRANVGGLVRLYAKIQQDCKTIRRPDPRSSGESAFNDPLVVLAAARNKKATYECGWFEFQDWKRKGRIVFSTLEGAALTKTYPEAPFMKPYLDSFARPAALLFDKIEMYRNLPYLRKQIEDLRGQDFEVADIPLEKIDREPHFESNSALPITNLEYACNVMRAFSSMVRQILARCKLDAEGRKESDQRETDGSVRDENYYLKELLDVCPELDSMKADLQSCIESVKRGPITPNASNCLSKTFQLILTIIDKPDLLPDPRPSYERDWENKVRYSDLVIRLQDIQFSGPYAVAVTDTKNLQNIADIVSNIVGITHGEAIEKLRDFVGKTADEVIKRFGGVALCAEAADNVILAASNPDEVLVAVRDLMAKTRTLVEKEVQLVSLGLLRAGIAWHETSLGEEFMGINPGMTAYNIAETRGRPTSSIGVTRAIYDRLPPSLRQEFESINGSSAQGEVFFQKSPAEITVGSGKGG
jgi:excisionase family DNA binding protein